MTDARILGRGAGRRGGKPTQLAPRDPQWQWAILLASNLKS
jgi:hypothetical protein